MTDTTPPKRCPLKDGTFKQWSAMARFNVGKADRHALAQLTAPALTQAQIGALAPGALNHFTERDLVLAAEVMTGLSQREFLRVSPLLDPQNPNYVPLGQGRAMYDALQTHHEQTDAQVRSTLGNVLTDLDFDDFKGDMTLFTAEVDTAYQALIAAGGTKSEADAMTDMVGKDSLAFGEYEHVCNAISAWPEGDRTLKATFKTLNAYHVKLKRRATVQAKSLGGAARALVAQDARPSAQPPDQPPQWLSALITTLGAPKRDDRRSGGRSNVPSTNRQQPRPWTPNPTWSDEKNALRALCGSTRTCFDFNNGGCGRANCRFTHKVLTGGSSTHRAHVASEPAGFILMAHGSSANRTTPDPTPQLDLALAVATYRSAEHHWVTFDLFDAPDGSAAISATAARGIPALTVVGNYTGVVTTRLQHADDYPDPDFPCRFAVACGDVIIDATDPMLSGWEREILQAGPGQVPNVVFALDDGAVYVVALRDIVAGEPLLTDYGPDFRWITPPVDVVYRPTDAATTQHPVAGLEARDAEPTGQGLPFTSVSTLSRAQRRAGKKRQLGQTTSPHAAKKPKAPQAPEPASTPVQEESKRPLREGEDDGSSTATPRSSTSSSGGASERRQLDLQASPAASKQPKAPKTPEAASTAPAPVAAGFSLAATKHLEQSLFRALRRGPVRRHHCVDPLTVIPRSTEVALMGQIPGSAGPKKDRPFFFD